MSMHCEEKRREMAKVVNAGEVAGKWRYGWVRTDWRNSCEVPEEFTDYDEFCKACEKVEGRGECESFYTCPMCGQVVNSVAAHLLDDHAEAIRFLDLGGGHYFVCLPCMPGKIGCGIL